MNKATATKTRSVDDHAAQVGTTVDAANDSQVPDDVTLAGRMLQVACHGASARAGWWRNLKTGTDHIAECRQGTELGKALVGQKLMLVVSEVAEGMEGHRKGLPDDKLPHRSMLEVELADAVIRIADLAGALGMDLGGAIAEKLAFNAVRPDHKAEVRAALGGKAY
jgi:NTP pyrophosphatase (non-canonical NTP hydrolase)